MAGKGGRKGCRGWTAGLGCRLLHMGHLPEMGGPGCTVVRADSPGGADRVGCAARWNGISEVTRFFRREEMTTPAALSREPTGLLSPGSGPQLPRQKPLIPGRSFKSSTAVVGHRESSLNDGLSGVQILNRLRPIPFGNRRPRFSPDNSSVISTSVPESHRPGRGWLCLCLTSSPGL